MARVRLSKQSRFSSKLADILYYGSTYGQPCCAEQLVTYELLMVINWHNFNLATVMKFAKPSNKMTAKYSGYMV